MINTTVFCLGAIAGMLYAFLTYRYIKRKGRRNGKDI